VTSWCMPFWLGCQNARHPGTGYRARSPQDAIPLPLAVAERGPAVDRFQRYAHGSILCCRFWLRLHSRTPP
jgi:hypothetical protein